jgi:hypothetical protein
MKRMLLAGLVGVVAIALATAAGAQDIPWKDQPAEKPKTDTPAPAATDQPAATTPDTPAPAATDKPAGTADPQTPAPGTPAKGSDVKPAAPAAGAPAAGQGAAAVAPPTDPRIARAVKPVEEQLKLAANQLELYEKEMAKPEKNRNLPMAAGCRLRAAQFYNLAAVKSKAAEGQFSKAEDKQIIIDQYEKPAREKAIALYLELADQAKQMNDIRTAITLYQNILKIDPSNATAKDALKAMEEAAKANAPTTNQPNNPGGSSTVPKSWETWRNNPTNYPPHVP